MSTNNNPEPAKETKADLTYLPEVEAGNSSTSDPKAESPAKMQQVQSESAPSLANPAVLKSQFDIQGIQLLDGGQQNRMPDIHRLDGSNTIVYKDAHQSWRKAPGPDLGRILENSVTGFEGDAKSWGDYVEECRRFILDFHTIDICIPLAGCKAGVLTSPAGKKILVSRDSGWLDPVRGDWSALRKFFDALLGDRTTCLLDWLHLALDDLLRCREKGPYAAQLRPHQALIMLGPAGCGKSLLKHLIVTAFGGSSADPGPYLFGETRFNEEIGGAVTLVIDDGTDSFNPMARSRLAQGLKRQQVSGEYRLEQKGRDVIMVLACQRIIILANEDAANTLPLIQESYRDKVHILEARSSDLVSAWTNEQDKNAWIEELKAALPALNFYLLNEHKIPSERFCTRYGMKAVHSERLLSLMVDDDTTEFIHGLAQYAISALKPPAWMSFPGCANVENYEWEGRASELFALIQQRCSQNVARSLRSVHQVGSELGKLALRKPKMYLKGPYIHGNQKWLLKFTLDYKQHRRLCDLYAPNNGDDDDIEPIAREMRNPENL